MSQQVFKISQQERILHLIDIIYSIQSLHAMPPKKSKLIKKKYHAVTGQAEETYSRLINLEDSDLPKDHDKIGEDIQNDTFEMQAFLLQQVQQIRLQKALKEEVEGWFPEDDIMPNDEALFSQTPKINLPIKNQQFLCNESALNKIPSANLSLIQNVIENTTVSLSHPQHKFGNIQAMEDPKVLANKKKESLENVKKQLFQLTLKKELGQKIKKEESNLSDQYGFQERQQLQLNPNNVRNFINYTRNNKDDKVYFQDEYENSSDSDQTDSDLNIDDFSQITQFIDDNQRYLQLQYIKNQEHEEKTRQMFLKAKIKQILEEQKNQIKQGSNQQIKQQIYLIKQKQLSENGRKSILSKINSEYAKNLRESESRSKALIYKRHDKKQQKLNNQTDQSDTQIVNKELQKKALNFCEVIGVKTYKFADEANKISTNIEYHEGINVTDKLPRKTFKQKFQLMNYPLESQLQFQLEQKEKSFSCNQQQKMSERSPSRQTLPAKRQSKQIS